MSKYKGYIKKDRYKRIIAQMLLSIFLFEGCTQIKINPVDKDRLLGKKEKIQKELTAKELKKINSGKITKNKQNDLVAIKTYSDVSIRQYETKLGGEVETDATIIELANLNPTQGFVIQGARLGDNSGVSVKYAGDVNADGISDVIIGAYNAYNGTGASYVVYGHKGDYAWPIDLSCLSADQGFIIQGAKQGDKAGVSANYAGDINVDGITDIIVGAYGVNNSTGASYIIYGKKNGYPSPINLASLKPTQGFVIQGAVQGGYSGGFVSYAGDVNADGINDVIIGASSGYSNFGTSYIVYGQKGGYSSPINLANLTSTQGVILQDSNGGDVSYAGDVNADGINDVIIGGEFDSSYVIYGRKGGYPGPIKLLKLQPDQGFVIQASRYYDGFGAASYAGDINADGIDDVIVGGYLANKLTGASYVVYGRKGGYSSPVVLANLNSTQGFVIQGAKYGDSCGSSVSYAGDVNGDGISDIIVGSSTSYNIVGTSYVIYGQKGGYPSPLNLANLTSTQGVIIQGIAQGDRSGIAVSYAGDVNADGISDVIVGATGVNNSTGASYIIYGQKNFTLNPFVVKNPLFRQKLAVNKEAIKGFSLIDQAHKREPKNLVDAKVTNPSTKTEKVKIVDDLVNVANMLSQEENNDASKRSISLEPFISASTSDGNSCYEVPWYSPVRWINILHSYWEVPKVVINTPEGESLMRLQRKCDRMIQEADSKTADKWYRFSLEDLQEDIVEMLKQSEEITEYEVKHYRARLEGIEKDFLRKPLLAKPSFFAGVRNRAVLPPVDINNKGMLLGTTTVPMLEARIVLPAIGK